LNRRYLFIQLFIQLFAQILEDISSLEKIIAGCLAGLRVMR